MSTVHKYKQPDHTAHKSCPTSLHKIHREAYKYQDFVGYSSCQLILRTQHSKYVLSS